MLYAALTQLEHVTLLGMVEGGLLRVWKILLMERVPTELWMPFKVSVTQLVFPLYAILFSQLELIYTAVYVDLLLQADNLADAWIELLNEGR